MLVSLKEARRIERRIQEKGMRKGYPLISHINIFSGSTVKEIIEKEAVAVGERVETMVALITARADIRRAIQVANEQSGINSIIAQRDKLLKLLCVWDDIVTAGEDLKSEDIITRTVAAKRMRAESGKDDFYGRSDSVDFVAITDSLYDHACLSLRETQRLVDQCDDNLAALNATTKIEISDDIVSLLEKSQTI